jgi:hypothetical protein
VEESALRRRRASEEARAKHKKQSGAGTGAASGQLKARVWMSTTFNFAVSQPL